MTVILTILLLAILTGVAYTAIKLTRTIAHHARYALGVRHLPVLTEYEARQNAKPLSSAIIHVADHTDRGEN